jgi:N-formylglutamate amidohydrolase
LIQCQEGELPIILTAPHGGKLPIAGVPERSKIDTPQFATVEDFRTNQLAERTAVQIEKDTGKKVFIVIAKFARKYADANRPLEYGTECDAAAKVHQEYHKTLKSYVDKVTKNFPQALCFAHGYCCACQRFWLPLVSPQVLGPRTIPQRPRRPMNRFPRSPLP